MEQDLLRFLVLPLTLNWAVIHKNNCSSWRALTFSSQQGWANWYVVCDNFTILSLWYKISRTQYVVIWKSLWFIIFHCFILVAFLLYLFRVESSWFPFLFKETMRNIPSCQFKIDAMIQRETGSTVVRMFSSAPNRFYGSYMWRLAEVVIHIYPLNGYVENLLFTLFFNLYSDVS